MYIVLVLHVLHYSTVVHIQVAMCAVIQIVLVLHVLHYNTAVHASGTVCSDRETQTPIAASPPLCIQDRHRYSLDSS